MLTRHYESVLECETISAGINNSHVKFNSMLLERMYGSTPYNNCYSSLKTKVRNNTIIIYSSNTIF